MVRARQGGEIIDGGDDVSVAEEIGKGQHQVASFGIIHESLAEFQSQLDRTANGEHHDFYRVGDHRLNESISGFERRRPGHQLSRSIA